MGAMCANVARGWLTKRTEEYLNSKCTDLDAVLHALKKRRKRLTLTDVLFEIGLLDSCEPSDVDMQSHLDKHWLASDAQSFWPTKPEKEEILRQGYIEAIRQMQKRKLKLSMLWVCAGHHFQCAISANKVCVTLLILTPHTPYGRPYPASTEREDMWVIGTRADIDEIVIDAKNHGGRPRTKDCDLLHKQKGIYRAPLFRPRVNG